jgi:hypothetical protein
MDLSTVSLRDAILAKIDRKMQLLAELESINTELAEAYSVLGEIPSHAALAILPQKAEPLHAVTKKPYKEQLVLKPCARCGKPYELPKRKKFCGPCFVAQAADRMTVLRRGFPQANRPIHLVEAVGV